MLLIECLVYISVWLLITTFSFALFYRALTSSKQLMRGTDDLAQAVKAGEGWRADLRLASGEVRLEPGGTLVIPRVSGVVQYAFTGSNVVRRVDQAAPWVEVVSRVRTSLMERQERGGTACWQWELELRGRDEKGRFRPLFTFLAVPGGRGGP